MRKPKYSIRENVYGEWTGYVGRHVHTRFGHDEVGAKEWLYDMKNPRYTYGEKNHPETGERAPDGYMWCKNLLSRKWFLEHERTPYTASPCSETYWSS